jgi:transposase
MARLTRRCLRISPRTSCGRSSPQFQRALEGPVWAHHRFLLANQLAHLDGLDELIDQMGSEIAERVQPVEHVVERVDAIPGFGRRTAEIVVWETGTDLSGFPSFRHLAWWLGLCPGNNESRW